jgi:hypothetical protein
MAPAHQHSVKGLSASHCHHDSMDAHAELRKREHWS